MTPPPNPTPEHEWLRKLVGDWAVESECVMGPGQPPVHARAIETVRPLGDLWVIAEGRGDMPGAGQMSWLMTLGYDPARARFVGSWIGSPMSHMFVYEGVLDAARCRLPLDTTGPSFADPAKTERYQDVIELLNDGTRTLSSHLLGEGGAWTRFMTALYRRQD